MIEAERKLTLEKANSILLQYQNRIKMCDLYAKRAQPFMNCVIAIEKNDEEEYKECVEKFVEEVKEQALELKRMEIRESKQKRIVYNTTKQWLKILERTNYSEWKTSREKNEIQKKTCSSSGSCTVSLCVHGRWRQSKNCPGRHCGAWRLSYPKRYRAYLLGCTQRKRCGNSFKPW